MAFSKAGGCSLERICCCAQAYLRGSDADPQLKRLQERITEAEEQLTGKQVETVLAAVRESATLPSMRPEESLFRVDIALSFPKVPVPNFLVPEKAELVCRGGFTHVAKPVAHF